MQALPPQLAGCKIFPCAPGTKDPATTHGWKEASSAPEQIARWMRVNPEFNWAVATGLSGLFVFDIDQAGLDWWAKLLERDPQIRAAVSRAFTVKTPKGGLHIYFKGEGPSTASRIAEGIDTRGGIVKAGKVISGGYVILPGSKTRAGPGRVNGVYEALPGGEIVPLPKFMAAIVPERKKTDTLGLTKNPDKDLPRNVQTANDLIANYVNSGRVSVEGKGGNNTAFQVCASILDKAISPGLAFDLLWEKWNPHCVPPFDEWELETLVRNAATHGEDTDSGAKGHQSNEDAFAHFAGMETPDIANISTERAARTKIQFIHEYADSVGDPQWLIEGVLPRTGVGMLYGASGSYKSFIALDLCLTLAFGIPGQWGNLSVEKQDVLYFAGEGPVGMSKKRFPAWMEHFEQEFRAEHRMMFKNRVPFYTDSEEWENIKRDLGEIKARPVLIVIDTLSRLMTSLDENTSKDAVTVMNFLEQLAAYYECFVLFIHHTGKDQTKGHRGSGVYFDNADTVMSTLKIANGTQFQIHKHKDADVEESKKYFKVKPIADSIVLLETNDAPPEVDKKGKPKVSWASPGEVIAVLSSKFPMGTSTMHLAKHIALKVDVEYERVSRILTAADDLKFLHSGNQWKIPEGDSDGEMSL